MRGSMKTIKHAHIRMPTKTDVKHSAVSLLNSEKAIDAALRMAALLPCQAHFGVYVPALGVSCGQERSKAVQG